MTVDQMEPFGVVLSRFRVAAGLTQEELAERAGLSSDAISTLERGVRTRPRPDTVRRLVEALALSPDDRASFEQAARAAGATPPHEETPPVGEFLGALPSGKNIGREEDGERCRAALDTVGEGIGHALVLTGEAGIGKTRLLQDLMVEAQSRGYLVLTGRCTASDRGRAYYPFAQVLSRLDISPPVAVRAEVQRRMIPLKPLTDAAAHSHDIQPEQGAVTREQFFSAVSDLLLLVARSLPVVLLLDDLQWADSESLRLLEHLARTARASRVLIAAAIRDTRLTEEHPELAQTVRLLGREHLAERVVVRRLSLEETTQFVGTLMGEHPPSEEFASFVYRRTKGIPRFIEHLVRSLGGRLELEGEIGAGAMGRVFRAYDQTREEMVAAKLVLARHEINLDTLLRFQQEGAVLAKLHHPHIVDIHDTFAEEHASCIIMELLEGQSLGEILQHGPLSLARSKAIALQVADALAYAHSQEIVHRDIKPDNLMVGEGDQVKVTDFGIARILQPDTSLGTIATTGMRMGTPLYMAPEQIEGKTIDGRTDVYALGAMLSHMVTGRPPFEGNDALSVAVKHLQEEPVAPSQVNPAIPADWDALILKAMAKDPAKRFQSAREMRFAIASLGEMAPTLVPAAHWRPRLLAAVGVVVAVLVATAAAWMHLVASHPPTFSAQLDGYLARQADAGHLSSTVLVARPHQPLFDKGYGYADKTTRLPNGPNTKYPDIAISTNLSITEIEHLIEQGATHWNDRICNYLPSCPATWKSITIRTLVDGTSRLPDYYWGRLGNTPAQTLAACQSEPLDPPSPGVLKTFPVEYQVCTALVLALIAQNANSQGGIPWGQNPLLQMAGLNNTGQMTDAIRSPERAQAYEAGVLDSPSTYNDFFVAYSTVADEYSFDNALFGGKLISAPNLKAMMTRRFAVEPASPGIDHPRWGYYWEIGSLFGHRVMFTYAGVYHFLSVNMRFADTGLTVIVLSNDGSSDVLAVGIHAAALALGIQLPTARFTAYVPRALLGTYQRIFTRADAHREPESVSLTDHRIFLAVHPTWVHIDIGGSTNEDEYYHASADGRVELTSFLPTIGNNNDCLLQPDLVPPPGYFRWSLRGKILTVTTVNGNDCVARATLFAGKWIKTG